MPRHFAARALALATALISILGLTASVAGAHRNRSCHASVIKVHGRRAAVRCHNRIGRRAAIASVASAHRHRRHRIGSTAPAGSAVTSSAASSQSAVTTSATSATSPTSAAAATSGSAPATSGSAPASSTAGVSSSAPAPASQTPSTSLPSLAPAATPTPAPAAAPTPAPAAAPTPVVSSAPAAAAPAPAGLVVGLNANVSGWGGASTAGRMSDVSSQTGTKWLREEFDWNLIEPARGQFDFSYYDHFMTIAAQSGERILAVFDNAPAWAGATPNTIPADPTDYAAALAALAQHYGPGGTFWTQNPSLPASSAITTFELWNEPYYSNGDNGNYDPARYANLVKAATTAARAANPATRYLLSAETTGQQTGNTWTNWIDALYQAVPDLNNYFDAVAIHPYGKDVTGLTNMGDRQMRRTELIHQIFTNHNAANKPLWITEIGWPTCDPSLTGQDRCTTPAGQLADFTQLITYLHTTWAPYVQAVFLYHYEDFGTDPTNSENFYGLTTRDHTPKPALALFKTLAATSA